MKIYPIFAGGCVEALLDAFAHPGCRTRVNGRISAEKKHGLFLWRERAGKLALLDLTGRPEIRYKRTRRIGIADDARDFDLAIGWAAGRPVRVRAK
jgi:hypothetical protein